MQTQLTCRGCRWSCWRHSRWAGWWHCSGLAGSGWSRRHRSAPWCPEGGWNCPACQRGSMGSSRRWKLERREPSCHTWNITRGWPWLTGILTGIFFGARDLSAILAWVCCFEQFGVLEQDCHACLNMCMGMHISWRHHSWAEISWIPSIWKGGSDFYWCGLMAESFESDRKSQGLPSITVLKGNEQDPSEIPGNRQNRLKSDHIDF